MRIKINEIGMDHCLERLNVPQQDRVLWLKRIKDDFNETIDNGRLIKELLKLSNVQLQQLLENDFSSLDHVFNKDEMTDDLKIRLQLLAYNIDSDIISYQHFLRLKNKEPDIVDRFSHAYIVDDFIIIYFEEFDE